MDLDAIAQAMDGVLRPDGPGREMAFLPSPVVQNHASFLCELSDSTILCAWFGGSLEGKSDICIRASVLPPGASAWGPAQTLSDDPDHSEQNPFFFVSPDSKLWLIHTVQPSGNQDECRVRMVEILRAGSELIAQSGRFLDLPRGSFVRAPMQLLPGGDWVLPLFRCVPREGQKWTGSHDVAAVAISSDRGESWEYREIPGSIGCVHTCPIMTETGFA
ncbi:MAG: exo-alpha-sialidase, partial [Mangrovicoccus sp.]